MKRALIFLKRYETASLFHKRFYRGKYLTSYQKRISVNEKQTNIDIASPEPISVLASLAVNETLKDDNNNDQIEETKISTETGNDPKLIEFINEYISANSEIRKLLFYGSENMSITSSPYNCCGCGSTINCESVHKPGYIPYEVYEKAKDDLEFMKNILCVRCFFLSSDLDPLDVSIDHDIYDDIIMKQLLKYKSGIVFLIADMSDLPFSIPLNLTLYNLSQMRLVLLGNKSDLLHQPNANSDYYKTQLIEAAKSRGIDKSKIDIVDLISAKDCNRIESILDKILSVDFYKNEPIFLIGSTNSGKSSLFNRLLKSDLCKSIAKSNIHSAVVSNVPGTTLNLLKFPMVNLSANFRNRRQRAKQLLSVGKFESSAREKYPLVESYKLTSQLTRSQTFYELVTYAYKDNQISSNSYDKQSMLNEFATQQSFDECKISTNKWLYDTPGLVNPDQEKENIQEEVISKLERISYWSDHDLFKIGWIGISGMKRSTCKIRAWTPAAIGCAKRVPSLMPYAVTRRSTRMTYSREFRVT